MTIPTVILWANHWYQQFSNLVIGNTFDPTKDIVLVTGGSSGLGKELARVFIENGAKVIVLDKVAISDDDEFMKSVVFYECDVSDQSKLIEINEKIQSQVGIVTILINNAAIMASKNLVDLSFEEIDAIIKVNLLSNFYTNKVFLPSMIELQRGYIITIASVLGYMSPAMLSAYGASKSGVIALHESLTYELGPPSRNPAGVKTLLVAPGQLKTKMFRGVQVSSDILAPQLEPSYVAQKIFESVQLGKRGEIKIPFYGKILPIFRALPWRITELARYFSGIDDSMKIVN